MQYLLYYNIIDAVQHTVECNTYYTVIVGSCHK